MPVAADVAAHPDEGGSGRAGSGEHDEGAGRRRAVLWAFAVLAPALWFGFLSRPPMWTDEAYTLRYATSWSTITDDVQPPAYYGIVHAWQSVLPSGLVSVRALSAAAFLGAVAVWAVLAARWVRQGRLPWVCVVTVVALSVVSPHALLFGRMARYFGLAALALGASLLTWWRAQPEDGRRWVVPAVIAHLCLAVLTPTTLIVVLVAESLTVLLRTRVVLRRQVVFVLATAALAAALVVLLPTNASKFGGADDVNHFAMAGVAVVLPLWSMTVGETVSPLDPVAGIPAALCWGVLAAALVAALRARTVRGDDDEAPRPSRLARAARRVSRALPAEPAVLLCVLLVVVQVVVQVGVSFTVNLAHTGIQAPKYFLPVAPALYLLVGLGVARILTWRRGGVTLVSVLTVISIGWGLGVWHLRQGEDFLYPSYALPWDQVVDQVSDVVATRAGEGHHVAVVSTDVAFQRILAERAPQADILDSTLSFEDSTVYHGALPGRYDTFIFITRQRINPEAELTVNAVMDLVQKDGFTPLAPPTDFGSVNPSLRHLQELVSGRTLEPYLVQVVTLTKV